MSTLSDENEDVSKQKQLDDVSRDPSDYAAADHLYIRSHRGYGPTSETRTDPPITGDVIRSCIQQGTVEDARNDCVCFVAQVDGTCWHLIANPIEGDVLTAYAPTWHEPEWASAEVTA